MTNGQLRARLLHWKSGLTTALICILVCTNVLVIPDRASGQSQAQWQDTGVTLPDGFLCVDGSQANSVLVRVEGEGTVAYNWATKEHKLINSREFDICTSTGLLFSKNQDQDASGGAKPAWRFSMLDPAGQAVRHMPSHVAEDGTLLMYAFNPSIAAGADRGRLWASADGGLTWQERGLEFAGRITSLAVSDADGKAIYILVQDPTTPSEAIQNYTVYFSADGGLNWDRRTTLPEHSTPYEQHSYYLVPIPGRFAPIDTLLLYSIASSTGSSLYYGDVSLSTDGARTFSYAASIDAGNDQNATYYYSPEGLLRWMTSSSSKELSLSPDKGLNWQSLPLPNASFLGDLDVSSNAPWNLFITGFDAQNKYSLYYSSDGGHTWLQFDGKGHITTPYLPMLVLGKEEGHLFVLDLPEAGKELGTSAQPLRSIDSGSNPPTYFGATGHNISSLFQEYWGAHGGLAQQGFPITEPFREVSSLNGKIYTVQYFERAVFEYHPENQVGNHILLSLLGVFQYKQKYPIGAPNEQQDQTGQYFEQTGHWVGGIFWKYWQDHGGLAQQGYPISDEFTETSPLNGQAYLVQYFERAVFEHHPENAGTPYEVLLSQLGATELRNKYLSLGRP